jgi:hypothetical protein
MKPHALFAVSKSFATITFDWDQSDPSMLIEFRGDEGAIYITHTIKSSALKKEAGFQTLESHCKSGSGWGDENLPLKWALLLLNLVALTLLVAKLVWEIVKSMCCRSPSKSKSD